MSRRCNVGEPHVRLHWLINAREAILFDGDLPVSKRLIRLERMETARKRLETFKTLHPNLEAIVLREANLSETAPQSRPRPAADARNTLPPPPFLVPAVLDAALVHDDFSSVQLVSEEADVACARLSKSSGAAVVTNDSDLALYELGQDGCVLFLRTLVKEEIARLHSSPDLLPASEEGKVSKSRLIASCIRPFRVAQRLGLRSLLPFGYERQVDSSAPASVIRARALDISMEEQRTSGLGDFKSQYRIPDEPREPTLTTHIDPRVSEVVLQSQQSTEPPNTYLPILHEDPSRDSSWSYGLVYRQLAYSCLYSDHQKHRPDHITEHARKGPRIAATSITLLNETKLQAETSAMLQSLSSLYISSGESSNATSNQASPPFPTTATEWHSLALCTVLQRKLDSGKTSFSHHAVNRLFGLDVSASPSKAGFAPIWDDIHLLANAQAVLYSWRTFKQIIDWTCEKSTADAIDPTSKTASDDMESLKEFLNGMPSLAELFLDLSQLRQASIAENGTGAAMVKKALETYLGTSDETRPQQEPASRKNKRRKISEKPSGKSKLQAPAGNAFALLSDFTENDDESDES
jgi:XPG domain containing